MSLMFSPQCSIHVGATPIIDSHVLIEAGHPFQAIVQDREKHPPAIAVR